MFLFVILLIAACTHSGGTFAGQTQEMTEEEREPSVYTITVLAKKGRTYANIRLAPQGDSPRVAKVPVGTALRCFGRDGDWFQVQVPESMQLGWIRDVYIEEG